jgi:aldose 1-epimerase
LIWVANGNLVSQISREETAFMSMRKAMVLAFCFMFLAACSRTPQSQSPDNTAASQPSDIKIGGEPVVTLQRQRPQSSETPQFLSLQVLPGRGMNLFQIKAYLPGKGDIDVIASPSLQEAAQTLNNGPEDFYDLKSVTMGGAILVPFANRVRGKLSPDGKTIETKVNGKMISLPANWSAKHPNAEKMNLHALILDAKFSDVNVSHSGDQQSVSAVLHGGNFDGHWFSKTDVTVTTTLAADAVDMQVEVKNVGDEPLPTAVGWHPYFAFPSGDRQQARLHIPAKVRALVNNYDDVLPTGKIVPVAGTPYDFTAPQGAALGTQFFDDSFVDLQREPDGSVVSKVFDPKANYGLQITGLSKEIRAIQVYSPPEKSYVALEPQLNYADPYGKEWGKTNTGMVVLKPGASVVYHVRLSLFTPK